jgi:hypothetical protein
MPLIVEDLVMFRVQIVILLGFRKRRSSPVSKCLFLRLLVLLCSYNTLNLTQAAKNRVHTGVLNSRPADVLCA